MKLTKEQKNRIYNKNMIVDDWEWVPCINHVLKILNYDDNLIHDENYETVKWCGTEPLIKDEKVRKAVRAWAEENKIGSQDIIRFDAIEHRLSWISTAIELNEFKALSDLEKEDYTIDELCGEEGE